MKKPRHSVSDHALVRYLERVEGIDMDALRREIGARVDRAADGHDGMSSVIIDGFRYLLSDEAVVITVEVQHRPLRGQGGRKPGARS